jgi:hypothetical protein
MGSEWYFEDSGNIAGPVSYEILAARIRGARDKTQLAWTQGMENWADVRQLQAFADLFATNPSPLPPPLSSPSSSAIPDNSRPISDTLPPPLTSFDLHPWRRYFARMIDWFAGGALFGLIWLIVALIDSKVGGIIAILFDERGSGWLLLALYIPLEALLLATFGTTIGKYIYKIKITPQDHFTYSNALRRSLLVWWRGLGTGFPLVGLITLPIAYRNLKNNRVTSWDRDCNCHISHSHISRRRWIAIYAFWGLLVVLMVLGIIGEALDKGAAGA